MTPLQVTYVVGSSHSGSTLLAFLADQHPQIASVGETAIKRQIRWEGRAHEQACSCGSTVGACAFWQRIFSDMSAAGVPFDVQHWSTDYRFEHPWADAVLTRETSSLGWRNVRRWATRHLPPLNGRMAHVDRANLAFVRAVLARRGARVFFDTTKLLTRLTYLLEVPEFDVRVVQLVRDVRGFAASAKRRGESVVEAAAVWLNDQTAVERVLAQSPGIPMHLLKYEDLCGDLAGTLSRLWSFCGVAPADVPSVLHPGQHHILGNSMRLGATLQVRLDDSWRSRLGTGDEDRVLGLAGALNERLGYARA
jgi:hypothetical protein